MKRCWVLLAMAILSLAVFSVPARADEAPEKPNPAEQPIGKLFQWINFAIVLGVGGYFIAKKGPAFFRGRADAISSALTEAAAAKAAADRESAEAEAKMARLGQEVAAMRARAQLEAEDEAKRIRQMTLEESEKIARAGRAEIEAAEHAAMIELKALTAKLAVERAEALLVEQMTPNTQEALFRAFVKSLPEAVN